MRFHLIDRVEGWTPGSELHGRKATSPDEDFWEQTPDGPVMPAGLVLEALAQAGTWLLLLSSGYRERAALAAAARTEWYQEVVPGDVLDLHVTLSPGGDGTAVLDGTVSVCDRVVLRVSRLTCLLVDAERFEDTADTERLGRQLVGSEVLR